MSIQADITTMFGTLIMILLGIIAFFLIRFFDRFDELVKDWSSFKERYARNEQRMDHFEMRLEKIEEQQTASARPAIVNQ